MLEIIQIVSRLYPSIDGVGDYALLIARQLRSNHGLDTVFIVCDPIWCGEHPIAPREPSSSGGYSLYELEGFTIYHLHERTSAGLFDLLSLPSIPTSVLLHYVSYGYEKRGCPLWLIRGLQEWKRIQTTNNRPPNESSRRLFTMFHELFASGKPWQSSFWTHLVQKRICHDFARLSDGAMTNRIANTAVLNRMRGKSDVISLAVFSNVGEPQALPEFEKRKRRLVLFGGKGWRKKALDEHLDALKEICDRWQIEDCIEIGSGETATPNIGMPWIQLGELPAQQISQWLKTCLVGFVCYESPYLEKSGIFAAYAAHGVIPVLPAKCILPITLGVENKIQYLDSSERNFKPMTLKQLSSNVFDWYQLHRLECHASWAAVSFR